MQKLWTLFLLFGLTVTNARTPGSIKGKWDGQSFKALIPKGILLSRLKDGKKMTLPKDLYARVLKGDAHDPKVYVINKRGEMLYSVPFHQVIFIDQVSDLFKPPMYYEEYSPPPKAKEDPLEFFQELSFVLYQLTSEFLTHIESRNVDNIWGQGLLYQAYMDFDLSVLLGGQFHYSLGQTDSLNDQFKIQQLALGPIINIPFTQFNERKVFFQIGTLISVLFDVKSSRQEYQFRSQSLKIGVQAYHPSSTIDFMFGIHFSRKFMSPVNKQLPNHAPDTATQENQLSFLIGGTW